MSKRRPALSIEQLGFTFDAPLVPHRAADLAGLEAQVAAAVGYALKDDVRSREEVAGAMSALLGDEVSRWMLDGYASEGRGKVNISFARFLALIAVTNRHDLLDALARKIGAAVLIGEEIHLARMGDLETRIAAMGAELKALKKEAIPMGRAG